MNRLKDSFPSWHCPVAQVLHARGVLYVTSAVSRAGAESGTKSVVRFLPIRYFFGGESLSSTNTKVPYFLAAKSLS